MERKGAGPKDVAIPAPVLTALRRVLRKEAGPVATVHALHDAGYVCGDHFFRALSSALNTAPRHLAEGAFWAELKGVFQSRGWGSFEHRRIHPGFATLQCRDCAEADPEGGDSQPGCAFTTASLSQLLTRVAESPIAVLEVACRSRGDRECRFIFGSESAIQDLYGLLLRGRSVEEAVRAL